MTKSLGYAKFQLNLPLEVSGTSTLVIWTRVCSCKATILNPGPFTFKFHIMIVLPILNLLDNSFGPYLFSVDHSFHQTVDYSNVLVSFPINSWPVSLIHQLCGALGIKNFTTDKVGQPLMSPSIMSTR
jgi:hypothetical protein